MKNALLLFAIAASALFSSCGKTPVQQTPENKDEKSEQKPIQISAPVANAVTDFSFEFFKTLQTDPEVTGDIFVSPLSLHMALGMLVNGATGPTKTEIMKTLKAENISQEELNTSYKKLLAELPAADPKVKLALANSIWNKAKFVVEPTFTSTLKNYFNAETNPLTTVDPINKWASDNTNGKIPKVLNKLDDALVLILMNALYFKGDWSRQFKKENTFDQPFQLEGGGSKTVKMMNMTDSFAHASFSDYSMLQLPYGNGQFLATLILPAEGKTITSVLDAFNSSKWMAAQSQLQTKKVKVGLPKFSLTQEFLLNNTLKKMGMPKAFTDVAEFNGISKTPSMVSFVKQNTFVAVDEDGTEAAAVTTIGMVAVSAVYYPIFVCDRPFAFIISEKTSNTILFMGKVMSPQAD